MKKITIGKKIMEVISQEEYLRLRKLPNPMLEDTCVEMNGMVYPIQKRYDGSPGVCDFGIVLKYTKPVINTEEYSASKINDFTNCEDFGDVIDRQDRLRASEEAILSTKDNITKYVIADDDTPELAASKEVINSKNIDMKYYKTRFGNDAPNIIKLFEKKTNKTISINRIKTVGNAMDTDVYLTFVDRPNAINPMGREIKVKLTSGEEG